MTNCLTVLLGLSLGFLIHFLLSPFAFRLPHAAHRPVPAGLAADSPRPDRRPPRKCPLCGTPLADGRGVRVEMSADGEMSLLGCGTCAPTGTPSNRN